MFNYLKLPRLIESIVVIFVFDIFKYSKFFRFKVNRTSICVLANINITRLHKQVVSMLRIAENYKFKYLHCCILVSSILPSILILQFLNAITSPLCNLH